VTSPALSVAAREMYLRNDGSLSIAETSGGDPGGPRGQRTPTFLSGGVTYKAVTPSFDAMLMSVFFALYTGYGRRWLSLIKTQVLL